MQYDLSINQHNIKPHLDIEEDIQKKKEGLFTFNLKVSQGNIEDFSKFQNVNIEDYEDFIRAVQAEFALTFDTGIRSEENAIRPDKR